VGAVTEGLNGLILARTAEWFKHRIDDGQSEVAISVLHTMVNMARCHWKCFWSDLAPIVA
jgi:hypothetical protein